MQDATLAGTVTFWGLSTQVLPGAKIQELDRFALP